jgi:hypothetical protein
MAGMSCLSLIATGVTLFDFDWALHSRGAPVLYGLSLHSLSGESLIFL